MDSNLIEFLTAKIDTALEEETSAISMVLMVEIKDGKSLITLMI